MGIAHAILRLQNVYGEGQSLKNPYTGILSIFSTRIRSGLPLPIFEDGNETRDFVHVEDVVEVMLACIEKPFPDGATLNVGSGDQTSILDAAALLCRIMNSDISPHVTGEYRVGDIRHSSADIEQIRRVTGFEPSVGFEAGMKRLCEWVTAREPETDLLEEANAELKSRMLMG
jgi:dTDP-L-rhamnose 4-epimerase